MNASLLADLEESVTVLSGVGPVTAKRLSRLGLETIGLLLEHFPKSYEDRRIITSLRDVVPGVPVVTEARIIGHNWSGQRRSHLSIELTDLGREKEKELSSISGLTESAAISRPIALDDSQFNGNSFDGNFTSNTTNQESKGNQRKIEKGKGSEASLEVRKYEKIELLCFGRKFLARSLPTGTAIVVATTFEERKRRLVATDFDVKGRTDNASFGRIVPNYALTEGMRPAMIRRTMLLACDRLEGFNSRWDPFCRARNFLSISSAVYALHFPKDYAEMKRARTTIAYAELLQLQVFLRKQKPLIRDSRKFSGKIKQQVTSELSFSLTIDQQQALREILFGLQSRFSTARLLQGDVGCGKTLVALLAATCVIESGHQVALIVPTELLAVQHSNTATKILTPHGINVALLTGSLVSHQGGHLSDRRENLLKSLKNGKINLIVGTHALLHGDVKFHHLGLVIIDEQHRFGVLQRRQLIKENPFADLLLMTATPIPRSLALTVYGELELSVIRQLPRGRSRVPTSVTSFDNFSAVLKRVRTELTSGGQVYFVVPRIGQENLVGTGRECLSNDKFSSESNNTKTACRKPVFDETVEHVPDVVSVFRLLTTKVFPEVAIGMIHGSMNEQEKRVTMEAFRNGKLLALVTTTVIEVGIDVSNASAIVVLGAEHLGLSTLHQLRGRVGRSSRPGLAFLVHGNSLSPTGKIRLHLMEKNSDGFAIAERDLKNRGPGELIGLQQAGFPRFCVADLASDSLLAAQAREDARLVFSDGLDKAR